ncbi:MAG: DUF808 domain-containing protein [Neisseriaceae bacterium]|nr:DUF808 domain-containing protein [Neisseriaceae bacterium]
MAFASLLTLLDDIATTLDDVAVMTKLAAKKTVGIVGDDLAVNAEQVIGSTADRELPIVFKVAIGSLINKAILVPLALLISAIAPWSIAGLLIIGGCYLSFEGAEKILDFMHKKSNKSSETHVVNFDEKTRVKGAIRTDFVLSTEIIVIALGVISGSLLEKAVALSIIAVLMTVGVYGFVACIVKIDDMGLWLIKKPFAITKILGRFFVALMPYIMKFLTIAGTIAMLMVGGSIILHNGLHHLSNLLETISPNWLEVLLSSFIVPIVISFIVGLILIGLVKLKEKMFSGSV